MIHPKNKSVFDAFFEGKKNIIRWFVDNIVFIRKQIFKYRNRYQNKNWHCNLHTPGWLYTINGWLDQTAMWICWNANSPFSMASHCCCCWKWSKLYLDFVPFDTIRFNIKHANQMKMLEYFHWIRFFLWMWKHISIEFLPCVRIVWICVRSVRLGYKEWLR